MIDHSHLRMRRFRLIGLLLAIALAMACLTMPGAPAQAAKGPIDIGVEPGFDGKAKTGSWFPVRMTLTNTGDDVSGDLAVTMPGDSGGGGNIAFVQHVDLPKMSTKVVWLTLPGAALNPRNNKIEFYENAYGKGRVVPFVQGDVAISLQNLPPNTLTVGVAARDPDTLNFLSLLAQRGYQVQTTQLAIDAFPWEATMLDGLDVIVLNDAPTDALTDEQVGHIRSWVETGGRLVLAGGASYAKTASVFADLSPVTVSGTTTVTDLAEFVRIAGKPLTWSEPITVSNATATTGKTLLAENGVPLVVNRPAGQGSVTYVAYDLAMEPLASWSGNAAVWERILAEGGTLLPPKSANVVRPDNNMWELNYLLDIFPELTPPAYGLLTLLLLLYAIFVAPVLYAVLKKMDRREWAWFVIPAIAVVTSVAIYAVGASDRGSTLAQTLGINELSGTGTASRLSASSVFVPSGGDYELEWEGKRAVSPIVINSGGSLQAGEPGMIVRSGPDRTVAEYRNVPYWSVRKAFVAKESVADAGRFGYTIRYDASGVQGEIVNETKVDLFEAGLIIGGQWIRIGDIKAGEKKTFQSSLGAIYATPDLGSLVFPYAGSRDPRQRERALLNMLTQSEWNSQANGQAPQSYIIGFSRTSASPFAIDRQNIQSDTIDLYVQKVEPDFESGGRVYIPRGVLVPYVQSSTVSYMNTYSTGVVEVGHGEFTLVYPLPDRPDWQFDRVTLELAPSPQFEVSLWNESDQSWEPLTDVKVELDADRLSRIRVAGEGIRLKVAHSSDQGRFTYPTLSAEGTVKR